MFWYVHYLYRYANADLRSGYHPWFCHLLSVEETDTPIDKYTHYACIFIPENLKPEKSEQYHQILKEIIGGLPEPVRLRPLLEEMRQRIRKAQNLKQLVMIGEVGLDRSFRVPYPRHDPQDTSTESGNASPILAAENTIATAGEDEMARKQAVTIPRKTLTPFTTSTAHQLRVLEMQVELAIEFGINVSLHSVKAQGESDLKPCQICCLMCPGIGETIKFLRDIKIKYGHRFENRVNVDLHSCGGWSVESWISEASPSSHDIIESALMDCLCTTVKLL